jgi:hypothetical protein
MPLNAATEAARLSVAPRMDGGDCGVFSVRYAMSCAACVQVWIARFRAACRRFRRYGPLEAWDRPPRLIQPDAPPQCPGLAAGLSGIEADVPAMSVIRQS